MNDADYNYSIFDMEESAFDKNIQPVIDIIKLFDNYHMEKLFNFRNELEEGEHDLEYSEEEKETLLEQIENFSDYVSGCESYEPHSIESITYCETPKEEWELF